MRSSQLLVIVSILHTFTTQAQEIVLSNPYDISFNKDYCNAIKYIHSGFAIDNDGSKILVGRFDGENVAFDALHLLSTNKDANAFVAKYNADNEIMWIKNIGGNEHQDFHLFNSPIDFASDVIIDDENNIYVMATLDVGVTDVIDFDPEHTSTTSIVPANNLPDFFTKHNKDIFLVKYSSAGELLWLREISDDYQDEALKLSFDNSGNIIATGYLSGITYNTIDFDEKISYPNNEDLIDAEFLNLGFIARYSPDGDFIDVKGFGGGMVSKIHVQQGYSGAFYVAGAYNLSLSLFKREITPFELPKSKGFHEFAPQNEDIFIAKYSEAGQVEWTKTIHSDTYNRPEGIVLGVNENVYVAGYFTGSNVDFDIENTLTDDTKNSASMEGSAFVAKYDANTGDLLWLKTIEGGVRSRVQSIKIKDSYLIIGGVFEGTITLGKDQLESDKGSPFLAILDTTGNWTASKKIEKTKFSSISNLEVAQDGTIHYTGFESDDPNPTSASSQFLNVRSLFIGEANTDVIKDDIVAGLGDKEETTSSLRVYPNPARVILHFETPFEIDQSYLYNISGRLISNQQGANHIDILTFPEGVYHLKVILKNGKILSRKFLKKP